MIDFPYPEIKIILCNNKYVNKQICSAWSFDRDYSKDFISRLGVGRGVEGDSIFLIILLVWLK